MEEDFDRIDQEYKESRKFLLNLISELDEEDATREREIEALKEKLEAQRARNAAELEDLGREQEAELRTQSRLDFTASKVNAAISQSAVSNQLAEAARKSIKDIAAQELLRSQETARMIKQHKDEERSVLKEADRVRTKLEREFTVDELKEQHDELEQEVDRLLKEQREISYSYSPEFESKLKSHEAIKGMLNKKIEERTSMYSKEMEELRIIHEKEIKGMEKKVKRNASKIEALRGLQGQVTRDQKAKINSILSCIKSNEGSIARAQKEYEDLGSYIKTLSIEISEIRAEVSQLTSQKQALENELNLTHTKNSTARSYLQ